MFSEVCSRFPSSVNDLLMIKSEFFFNERKSSLIKSHVQLKNSSIRPP